MNHYTALHYSGGIAIALTMLIALHIGTPAAADPADMLILPVAQVKLTTTTTLLDPAHKVWDSTTDSPLHFNRTPPLYDGDPLDDGARPAASIRLLRIAGDFLVIRIRWTDPTEDRGSRAQRHPNAGSDHIYKQHTEQTVNYADAFCIMTPRKRGPSAQYPSMVMGEVGSPVDLYYWRAAADFQTLTAHGRATVAQDTVAPQPAGRAARDGDGWILTMAIPNMPAGTPVCVALWDGVKEHRDGLKYFSLWYEVQ